MIEFEDQFSKQANSYRAFRPTYPDSLFDHIASLTNSHNLAWDCATGNGQAASKLVTYFDHVIATDASKTQIENALQIDRVEFRVAPAEESGLLDSSVDLITVANALHWFDKTRFFQECKRVLKPNGILAAWCYEAFQTEDQFKDAFNPIYEDISQYWSTRLKDVRDHYGSIELPFEELHSPKMEMVLDWDLKQCLGFLRSWSACQNCIDATGSDPTIKWFDMAVSIWGAPETKRPVRWNIHLKLAKNS